MVRSQSKYFERHRTVDFLIKSFNLVVLWKIKQSAHPFLDKIKVNRLNLNQSIFGRVCSDLVAINVCKHDGNESNIFVFIASNKSRWDEILFLKNCTIKKYFLKLSYNAVRDFYFASISKTFFDGSFLLEFNNRFYLTTQRTPRICPFHIYASFSSCSITKLSTFRLSNNITKSNAHLKYYLHALSAAPSRQSSMVAHSIRFWGVHEPSAPRPSSQPRKLLSKKQDFPNKTLFFRGLLSRFNQTTVQIVLSCSPYCTRQGTLHCNTQPSINKHYFLWPSPLWGPFSLSYFWLRPNFIFLNCLDLQWRTTEIP